MLTTSIKYDTIYLKEVIHLINVEIECKCIDCEHSEYGVLGHSDVLYCYYWDYEQGDSLNEVEEDDFCSNAIKGKGK